MLASEMEDRLGEGVVHANMGTTHEMLSNMEEALVNQEKVSSSHIQSDSQHARNSVMIVNGAHFRDLILSSSTSSLQQLHAMQQAGNLHGEALALESMAHTLEYMGSISQACETLESVCFSDVITISLLLRLDGVR